MGKTLVLMRHGKAQPRDLGIPDDERTLTRAGTRALAARLPQNLRLWGKRARTAVWTSPAVRCRQTADALVTALRTRGERVPDPLDRAFLHDQDIDAFLADVAQADADCIVCVGHNPFIEEATELLCGARIHFRPGALAAFELSEDPTVSDPSSPLAPMIWFVQGTPVDGWSTLCDLEDVIVGAHERMEGRLAAFLADPDDVETLHKLRVSIRTLRSLLKFAAPFHRAADARAVQQDLRSIVVPTSRLRELDVLADEARRMEPPSDDLVAACLEMRAAERDRVLAILAGGDAKRALERIASAVKPVRWKRRVEKNGLSREAVARRFADMEAGIDRKLATTDLAAAEATHDLRKCAKRVRYAAENYAAFLDADEARAASERMKAVQDELGALCDARVNVGIIDELPRKGLSDQALRDLDALEAKSRYFIATKLRAAGKQM